jgi:hypothetical protein
VSVERRLLAGVGSVLTAVGSVAALPDGPRLLLRSLGWDLPPGVDDIGLAALDVGAVGQRLTAWTELAADPEADEGQEALALAELALAVGRAIVDLSAVELAAPQDYLDRTGIVDDFLPRLLDLSLVQAAGVASRPAFDVAVLLGLVELRREPADPARFQVAHLRHVVHWERLETLVTEPSDLLRDVYGWGTPAYDATALVVNLGAVLQHLAVDVRRRQLGPLPLMRLQGGPPPAHPPLAQLFLPLLGADVAGSSEAGMTVFGLPPTTAGGADGGLGVAPYARGTAELRVPLTGRLSIGLAAEGDLGTGTALVLRPGRDPDLRTGLNTDTPASAGAGAAMSIDLTLADHDTAGGAAEPVALLAEDDLSLTARTVEVRLTVDVAGVDPGDVAAVLRLAVAGGTLTLHRTGLPFLDDLVPDEGLTVEVDADLSYSSRDGVRLGGQASLTLAQAVDQRFGPLTVNRVELSLGTTGGGVESRLGLAASLAFGPVELSVAGIGVRAAVDPHPGNLGSADLAVRATPPDGIGVVIDAEVVTGGGFVRREPSGDYVGALELQLGQVGVKAIGTLSTGQDWSMLVLLYAQIPPVQIGFGFTLVGVGGVLGVHRAVDVPQLVTGMRTGVLDDLLFPADPVGDAPRIIATLRRLLPIRRDCLTIGPMVDVHWGQPVILTARLAVLLQLDHALGGGPLAPSKVVVVGQLRVAVGPTQEDPDARVLLLLIDVLGFWDLTEKRYGVLAALRDSSVAGIDLTGGLAVWGEYGDHPRFLLAAGGFNPRFKDIPATLGGAIDRLGASFTVGRFALTLAGYFAVTPATIQAGLDLHAVARIGPVGLEGRIGFDVLIYRRPRTHFIADFRFSAEVTYRGRSLAGVKVTGSIEGPGRWHVVGKVSFSILWWDISKSFDEAWGTPAPRLVEQVDVRALLAAELDRPENWSAQVPAGGQSMVTLAPRRGDLAPRAHPLARCVFTQQAVPFGLALDRFGDAAVAGPNQFDVVAVTVGGRAVAASPTLSAAVPVREHFARAQFVEVPEEDRLSRPAYEQLDAGVEFASAGFEVSGRPVRTPMSYETRYLDLDSGETSPDERPGTPTHGLAHAVLQAFGQYGAAGRSPQRAVERAASVRVPLGVAEPQVAAADRETLAAVAVTGPATTASVLVEQRLRRAGLSAQVVERFELAGS